MVIISIIQQYKKETQVDIELAEQARGLSHEAKKKKKSFRPSFTRNATEQRKNLYFCVWCNLQKYSLYVLAEAVCSLAQNILAPPNWNRLQN